VRGDRSLKIDATFNHWIPKEIKANLRWRRAVHERVREDPEYASVIVDACSRDPLFFLNGFGYTYDPRRQPFSKIPFILYPYQEQAILDLIRSFNSHDTLIEKSRDMGASWILCSAFYWAWRFRKGLSFLLISRTEDYVDKAGNPKALFWKLDYLRENSPTWLQPVGFKKSQHRRLLHKENPENGSVIDGESTTSDAGRGDRRTAIGLDEFAAVEQGAQVLAATRDATNSRIFNSTPKGINNAFYDMGQTSIRKIRLHWSEHPLKSLGLYRTDSDGNLKVLDPEGYPEGYAPILDGKLRSPWYDNECKRCASAQEIAQELDIDYLGSGRQYFHDSAVQDTIRKYARPPIAVGGLEHDVATAEPISFRADKSGRLELWCMLDKDGNPPRDHKYVIGCDISAGTGASNSCAQIWDATTKEKVGQYTNPNIRPEAFAKQCIALARWFHFAPEVIRKREDIVPEGGSAGAFLIWESNGPGRAFGSVVMELGYGNIYLRQRDEAISGKVSDIPGWASTKDTKTAIMESYRAAVEKGECINCSKEALDETLEYVWGADGSIIHARSVNKGDPSGAKSNHGDRVMADALAWKGLGARLQKPVVETRKIPIGSLAWRNQQRELSKVDPDRRGW
jgi:hypothetical protein